MVTPIRKLALLLGNDEYRLPINKLNKCCQNAHLLSNVLKNMNFQVTQDTNIKKRKDMVKFVSDWCEQIQEGDLLFFYYSGHGFHVRDQNYLLLTDDDFENHDEAIDSTMPVSNILERLHEKYKTNVTLLVLDCCRPYRFRDGTRTTGLKRIEPKEQLFIQFACAEGRNTSDNFFSESLLEHISTRMEIRALFRRIRNEVRYMSDDRQVPLSIYNGRLKHPVYLCEPIEDLPDIPLNAKWERHADTVMGGLGRGPMLKRHHTPKGLWVRKNKSIVIADCANHRIVEYGPDKKKRKVAGSRISGYGFSQLFFPTDVVFQESTNSFLICDARNRRVLRWSPGRKVCDEIIIDKIACYGIAVDSDDNIYVSNTEKHEVRRYAPGDRRGVIVAGGHGRGSRLHQLNGPTYICIGPNKSLYVSDSENNRVVKWDLEAAEGVIFAGGNGKGRNLSQLDYPTGLVVDRNGTLYVADHWNNRVMRWCKDRDRGERIVGELLPGDSPTQINGPEGLRFDRKGNLCVVDGYNHRVQKFKIRPAH